MRYLCKFSTPSTRDHKIKYYLYIFDRDRYTELKSAPLIGVCIHIYICTSRNIYIYKLTSTIYFIYLIHTIFLYIEHYLFYLGRGLNLHFQLHMFGVTEAVHVTTRLRWPVIFKLKIIVSELIDIFRDE